MDSQILHKAAFLLHECHEPEQTVVERLKEYFPALSLVERERYVQEAWDQVHSAAVDTL
ncbi:hypothetical protein OG500_31555 [Kitasatospora sp. NBC_01250]|uniref:hypothetical protein n=1 Tax=unclassified Kitasatospora TaxID=2633591 RepID=UPI002E135F40|nr:MULTISPECIES: hypothetical protein [unclassified Kitasatospora]WSJ70528.1 hypothetical protein OG294_33020 [Kitasatospora sp. NBC_01302]